MNIFIYQIKASKLLTKQQRKEQYGLYIALFGYNKKITFEKFLTKTYKLL
jgi:hypothetical protein